MTIDIPPQGDNPKWSFAVVEVSSHAEVNLVSRPFSTYVSAERALARNLHIVFGPDGAAVLADLESNPVDAPWEATVKKKVPRRVASRRKKAAANVWATFRVGLYPVGLNEE